MNLGPPVRANRSLRPHQLGRVCGKRNGIRHEVTVEWLVDTGADLTVVRADVGTQFDARPVGLTAAGTTGGGGIQVVTGLSAEFSVLHPIRGSQRVLAHRYVGVKSNNAGSNLLGMEHLAEVGARIIWSPRYARGALMVLR